MISLRAVCPQQIDLLCVDRLEGHFVIAGL